MQALIELTLNLVAALALAVLAQVGLGRDDASEAPRPERVVARSPQAQAAPTAPERAVDCPELHIPAPVTA